MIIGVTGASGSGKTTVSKILAQKLNCKMVDADKVAKRMSLKGNKYYDEILNYFGQDILDNDNQIDRKKLANIVYNDKDKLEALNSITNIYVVDEIKKETFKLLESLDTNIVIIDVPRLIESGLNEICDVVIATISKEDIKLQRICARDDIDTNKAKERLKVQPADKFYIQNSDYIIKNNDINLEREIDLIVNRII